MDLALCTLHSNKLILMGKGCGFCGMGNGVWTFKLGGEKGKRGRGENGKMGRGENGERGMGYELLTLCHKTILSLWTLLHAIKLTKPMDFTSCHKTN